MYVDPLAIYREYIQNAADAIDEARVTNLLGAKENGQVEIDIDLEQRSVRVRDNGTGIPAAEFENRMTSFGASAKRGTNARGFRGVGRLSGLAYCQELIFRSRNVGEAQVSELRWDCRKAKSLLRSTDFWVTLPKWLRNRFRFAGWTGRNGRGISSRLNSATFRVSGVIGC